MSQVDVDLALFAAQGAPPLPRALEVRTVESRGARIWSASSGEGPPILLLHGGLGHSGNWGHQVAALVSAGRRVLVIDTRGHGRSTRDTQAYSYELLAWDAAAVLDAWELAGVPILGWSDGACTALVLAMRQPARVTGVFYLACNMDPTGTRDVDFTKPAIGRCFARHQKDYAEMSPTPDDFKAFSQAVDEMMKTQPNFTAADLGKIAVPVAIAQSEDDEFIRFEHAQYLAGAIPGAELVRLEGVSHFAPLQRPEYFTETVLAFLRRRGL